VSINADGGVPVSRLQLGVLARHIATVAVFGMGALAGAVPASTLPAESSLPVPVPAVSDYQLLATSTTPPAESACLAIGRRCFRAAAMENSYNLPPLYAAGHAGQGVTIAIIDSFGNPNMASDLANFDTQMGLQHMCGEPGQACGPGIPTFHHVYWNGKTEVKAPPANSNGTGSQDRNAWTVETSLDVEWAHAIAPDANILNVTTDPAETQGVQGFPAMMNAEQFIVDNQQATVITQSFGAVEEGFGSSQALMNLRHAFISAAADGVTVLASSGDGGSANSKKTPVKNPTTLPFPTVNWPASDPLVTAVGGTYLCTNPVTGVGVDSADAPSNCQANPGVREVGWIASGGGFSHIFATPAYQGTLPAGSTNIGGMRGVPDVAFQASSRTGPLVYDTAPGAGGWFIVGGTSCSSPQFAGVVAIADQIAGHGLGQINPTLYQLAAGPNHGTYFFDVTTGNNQADPAIPGYPATTGWDPVTGLGTPNAAALAPALAAG
jgi:subtilase family serine protease